MNQEDKKEIAKILGEVLEQNVLPVVALKSDLEPIKKDIKSLKTNVIELDNKLDRVERKLDTAIDRYDETSENHEERILVLEGKKKISNLTRT